MTCLLRAGLVSPTAVALRPCPALRTGPTAITDGLRVPVRTTRAAAGTTRYQSGLAFSGPTAGEAADHGVDRGTPDERFRDGRVAFVVAGQPAVCGQPGQAAFHDPAFRVRGEAPARPVSGRSAPSSSA